MGGKLSCPCMCSRQQTRSEEMVQCHVEWQGADACLTPQGERYENELVAGPIHVASTEPDMDADTSERTPKDLFLNVHVADREQEHSIKVSTELWPKCNKVDIMVKEDGILFFNYDMRGQIRRYSM